MTWHQNSKSGVWRNTSEISASEMMCKMKQSEQDNWLAERNMQKCCLTHELVLQSGNVLATTVLTNNYAEQQRHHRSVRPCLWNTRSWFFRTQEKQTTSNSWRNWIAAHRVSTFQNRANLLYEEIWFYQFTEAKKKFLKSTGRARPYRPSFPPRGWIPIALHFGTLWDACNFECNQLIFCELHRHRSTKPSRNQGHSTVIMQIFCELQPGVDFAAKKYLDNHATSNQSVPNTQERLCQMGVEL
jgi:hypothetical protein